MDTTEMNDTKQMNDNSSAFAIPLLPDTELGLAILITENEDGHYEPIAVAGTINEAKELAELDMRKRMRLLDQGDEPGMCPYTYKLWARGIDGDYRLALELDADSI